MKKTSITLLISLVMLACQAQKQYTGYVKAITGVQVVIVQKDSTEVSILLLKNAPVPVIGQVVTATGTNNTYRATRRKINCKVTAKN